MKQRLLEFLVCPACRGRLTCDTWCHLGDEIQDGLLRCGCGASYPIIRAVPRMVVGAMQAQLRADYPEFFVTYAARLPAMPLNGVAGAPPETNDPVGRTRRSFGFEWTAFSGLRPEWERNFWGYLAPKTAEFLHGKLVLDAGCGMGRHLFHTAHHASEVIGVDFSQAVDAAYRNTASLPNAHVVQADLTQLPFRPATFDFVYCLGVLHHLPDPEGAFRTLLRFLKAGGEARIYVYWSLRDAPRWKQLLLAGVTALRHVTVRLPHQLLLWLCYPIALLAWLCFVFPSHLLSRFPSTRHLARALPLNQYAAYPFGVLLNDQFDRFSAPLERRYGPAEVRAWLAQAGLEDVTVAPYAGWLGHGRKRDAEAPFARLLAPSEAGVQ